MKINFTKKEFRLLIDIFEITEWVLHAHKTTEPEETKKYSELIQKIFSYADQIGCTDLIKYDNRLEGYYATRKYEEESEHMAYIEEFEDDVFWEELTHRLAVRDLVAQEGEDTYQKMDISERASKIFDLEGWYEKEFIENGLRNIKVESKKSSRVN